MNIAILIILISTSIATSTLGVYLVLRKMSMLVDSISHTVLLGIVIAFMFVGDLSSPLLIIGAALMGLVTVFLTEIVVKTKKASEDSATGLIFPLLFSIAVILISTQFSRVHLDIDAVLLGKIEFAPFDKLELFGIVLGPKLMYIMGIVMIINLVYILVFYKELKLVSFDAALAATLGITPFVIHYSLMTLVSITAVSAFNAVGSILVVALMIGPAATAVMMTKDIKKTLILASSIGIINSILGYAFALLLDVNISGMIATMTLCVFLIVVIFEPNKGMITSVYKRRKQKQSFDFIAFIFHVYNHKNQIAEININQIAHELNWKQDKLDKQLQFGLKEQYITVENDIIYLTDTGKAFYQLKVEMLSIH